MNDPNGSFYVKMVVCPDLAVPREGKALLRGQVAKW